VAERYPPELADLLIANPNDSGELVERLTGWRTSAEAFRTLAVPLSERLRARTWDAMAAEIADLVENASAA